MKVQLLSKPWVLLIFVLVGCAAREDGLWVAERIDGKVAPQNYEVTITEGQVVGGRDGCNRWEYLDAKGTRSDGLAECMFDPLQAAYTLAVMEKGAKPVLLDDGKLRLASQGHEVIFLRRAR